MNTLSKISAGAAIFALVALLGMPIAGAAGGDGTGPAPGTTGRQMMDQNGKGDAPCYGPGQGRGPCRRQCRNCNGPDQGRGGFVDKDGDGICDLHPDNGKGDAATK